jgi:hypothetical protein
MREMLNSDEISILWNCTMMEEFDDGAAWCMVITFFVISHVNSHVKLFF